MEDIRNISHSAKFSRDISSDYIAALTRILRQYVKLKSIKAIIGLFARKAHLSFAATEDRYQQELQ